MPNRLRHGAAERVSQENDPRVVLSWFESQSSIPLAAPPRFREYGPLADDPDVPDATFPIRFIEGATFGIEYLDLRGWVSTRTIRCIALNASRPALLQAYCNVRKTTRTFRLDRIIATTNLSTGITSQIGGQRVLFAPAFLPEDPVCRAFVNLIEATRPGVFLLLFIAMRNGNLSRRAREIILTYLAAEARHRKLDTPPADFLALWLENLSPSKQSVLDGIAKLLGDSQALIRLLPCILEIGRVGEASDAARLLDLVKALRQYYRPHNAAQAIELSAWR